MRRFIISMAFIISSVNISFAQGPMQQKEGPKGMSGQGMMGMHGMMGGKHSGMYGMMIHHLLMKANSLELTGEQKKELSKINETYLYEIVRKEADFKISHMKVIDMLHDPNFDPSEEVNIIRGRGPPPQYPEPVNREVLPINLENLEEIRRRIAERGRLSREEPQNLTRGGRFTLE